MAAEAEYWTFPTDKELFDQDERISFSKLDNKYIAVQDDGTEYEFDEGLRRWIPIIDEALIEQQQRGYMVPGVDDDDDGSAQGVKRKMGYGDDREVSFAAKSEHTTIFATSATCCVLFSFFFFFLILPSLPTSVMMFLYAKRRKTPYHTRQSENNKETFSPPYIRSSFLDDIKAPPLCNPKDRTLTIPLPFLSFPPTTGFLTEWHLNKKQKEATPAPATKAKHGRVRHWSSVGRDSRRSGRVVFAKVRGYCRGD